MMKKIKRIKCGKYFGAFYATGKEAGGLPGAIFFWVGDECPTWLCQDRQNYAYTHGGKAYQEACEGWPEGFSQDY